ncbi:MAG: small multi-drug export protein, partial [Desulfotomaculaceae bacterium]|nr:small multi-drug export protein [Desulfotomaculaceae bacterium]
MELIIKILTVIGLGIIELWVAIPTGFALKLHPLITGLASGLGSILGALLVIIAGDSLCNWLLKKKTGVRKDRGSMYKVWNRYGVIGLGMLSPLITGAP